MMYLGLLVLPLLVVVALEAVVVALEVALVVALVVPLVVPLVVALVVPLVVEGEGVVDAAVVLDAVVVVFDAEVVVFDALVVVVADGAGVGVGLIGMTSVVGSPSSVVVSAARDNPDTIRMDRVANNNVDDRNILVSNNVSLLSS